MRKAGEKGKANFVENGVEHDGWHGRARGEPFAQVAGGAAPGERFASFAQEEGPGKLEGGEARPALISTIGR